jgi:hypothetical protein
MVATNGPSKLVIFGLADQPSLEFFFFRHNPIKMDDLGVPPFQETSICQVTLFIVTIEYYRLIDWIGPPLTCISGMKPPSTVGETPRIPLGKLEDQVVA